MHSSSGLRGQSAAQAGEFFADFFDLFPGHFGADGYCEEEKEYWDQECGLHAIASRICNACFSRLSGHMTTMVPIVIIHAPIQTHMTRGLMYR